MQRGVLLGAGAAVLIAGGALALRGITHHESAAVTAQTVDQLLAIVLPGASVRHGETDHNALTGTTTVHGLVVARPGGAEWTADTVTLTNVRDAALRDVFDPAAYPGGKPAWTERRLLVGDVTAEGVRASTPGDTHAEVTMKRVELHGLSGRPFAAPPTPENRAAPGFGADAALAFAFDSETMTGLAMSAQGPNPFKATVETVGTRGYDSGKVASLSVKGVAVDGSAGKKDTGYHATLDKVDMADADGRALLEAVEKGSPAAAVGFNYGTMNGAGLAVQITGGPAISLHDMHGEPGAPDAAGNKGGKGVLNGLTLGLGETVVPPSMAPGLAAFGMNAVTIDVTATTHAKAGGHYEISEDLVLHDLGTLHLKGAFSGYVAPAGPKPATSAAVMALMGTRLDHAEVVWDDASLTNRLFKVAAVQSHTTPELMRAQLAMPIVALGVMVPDQPDAADQVTHFLDHPHVLAVTMNPPQAMTLAQVGSAPAVQQAHLLGVHVTAN